jgi:pyridinium-3,5-biscarboxylic acid mononucleotide synthase
VNMDDILARLADGSLTLDEAKTQIAGIEDLGFARVDHDRAGRTGLPEVVYGPGKTPDHLREILGRLHRKTGFALATRIEASVAKEAGRGMDPAPRYDPETKLFWLGEGLPANGAPPVAVCAAGTSDRPVAREAARVAELFGNRVDEIHDVGVAGLSRLLAVRERLAAASVVIAVAGMEAALFSVVKGLVPAVVVAVPTSVGGGFQGVAAVLSALSACSSGVVTVGIDNGFGAAVAATLINRTFARSEPGASEP